MHVFGVVQAHGTSSILLEPHQDRESRACSVSSLSSGWFDCTEPSLRDLHRRNDAVVRKGSRRFDVHEPSRSHRSSGWFDCTEPSLTTSLQGKQGVQDACTLVRGGSSAANLSEPS